MPLAVACGIMQPSEQESAPAVLRQPDHEHWSGWLAELSTSRTEQDLGRIRRACEVAALAHHGQSRASGEPYITHPIVVADILDRLRMDSDTLVAAILHDVVEDTAVTLDELQSEFGDAVSSLVDGVTKMDVIDEFQGAEQDRTHHQKQVEALRKLLLAVVEDVRVVLIKLADRLHNMRTLGHFSESRQRRISKEMLGIYAPPASRLGIWQFKWEMEDLVFRYLEPETYRQLARQLDERRSSRETYIDAVVKLIERELEDNGLSGQVAGRPKHIYSIYRKMQSKHLEFGQLHDIRAIRILVDTVTDCYAALGLVHTLWPHIPREFDDYITNPKSNMYQSLHTAVVGPRGQTLEVQIRTRAMHQHAEFGVAAHWLYKENARMQSEGSTLEEKIDWLRQILEWKDESDGGLLERFRAEVVHDRVYVFTPAGQVVDLPHGATPLDFAYQIHTDVGHRCRGAKVDGVIVPLSHVLHTGKKVEILTAKSGGPSRDWLNLHLAYLKTGRARYQVRHWFRQQDYEKNLAAGRDLYERDLRRLGIENPDTAKLLERFSFKTLNDLLAAVGHGDITTVQIANTLQELDTARAPRELLPRVPRDRSGDGIQIQGVGNLMTQLARCCKPVPYDRIVGYITRGRGVSIHRKDCSNALRLGLVDPSRMIDVSWSERSEDTYPVDLMVTAFDRQGLLRDISAVVANENVNVTAMNIQTDRKAHRATMDLTVEVSNLSQLSRLLDRMSQLPSILEVHRQS